MITDTPPPRPHAALPQIVRPAPYEVSFGRVIANLPAGTDHVVLLVDGRERAVEQVRNRRVILQIELPARDVSLRLVAVGDGWRRRSPRVGPVLGLPPAGAPRLAGGSLDRTLGQRVTRLARSLAGTAAVYVQDLSTGRGGAWNARARFPAASTLKLAIAVETLRSVRGPPPHRSRVDVLLRTMILESDNAAANELETLIGGSTSGGSARVNATLRALGLTDTDMYGGYELPRAPAERPIPIETESQPPIVRTKYTTAWDLSRLFRFVHLAAGGRGPLLHRVGGFAPSEARYLLYLLAHVGDRGKLGRFLPGDVRLAHKAGWIANARHDSGIVYWPGGAFVATVMTWRSGGVGTSSDVLAGRVAEAALTRFRERR